MIQTFVAFLVPFQVSYDFLFFAQYFAETRGIVAVIMFAHIFGDALLIVAVEKRRELFQIFRCVGYMKESCCFVF